MVLGSPQPSLSKKDLLALNAKVRSKYKHKIAMRDVR